MKIHKLGQVAKVQRVLIPKKLFVGATSPKSFSTKSGLIVQARLCFAFVIASLALTFAIHGLCRTNKEHSLQYIRIWVTSLVAASSVFRAIQCQKKLYCIEFSPARSPRLTWRVERDGTSRRV